jgi:Spy/CpxP family protein refolding chaperone
MGAFALCFLSAAIPLCAQTNAAPAKPAGAEAQALSILTPEQRMEYAQAHEKALANDPALKAENDKLKQQYIAVMTSGTPMEKQAMLEKVDSHRQKLRLAMLKADPDLGPIFADIDRHISEAKAAAAAQAKAAAPAQ